MRYVTFNAWVGQTPRALLRSLLALVVFLRRPHGVFLQEVGKLKRAPRGYQLVQASEGDEERSSAILVRNDGCITRENFWKVPGGEWMWNGKAREARTFVRATVRFGYTTEEWICVHRVPNGPDPAIEKNRYAWAAEHDLLVRKVKRILRKTPDRRVVIGGDENTSLGDRPDHPKSLQTLADALGADEWMIHIDGFLIVNGPLIASLRRLRAKFGSDAHRPVVLEET